MKKKYYSVSLLPINNRLLLTLMELSKEYQFNLTKDDGRDYLGKFISEVSYNYFKYQHLTRCLNRSNEDYGFEGALWRYLTLANPDIDFVSPRKAVDEEGYPIANEPLVDIITKNVIAALSEACTQYILVPLGYVDDIQWIEWEVENGGFTNIMLICHGDYRIRRYHELVKDGTIAQ